MSSEKSYCEAQQIYPKQVYVDKTLIEDCRGAFS